MISEILSKKENLNEQTKNRAVKIEVESGKNGERIGNERKTNSKLGNRRITKENNPSCA
jgi:hypothetical protein